MGYDGSGGGGFDTGGGDDGGDGGFDGGSGGGDGGFGGGFEGGSGLGAGPEGFGGGGDGGGDGGFGGSFEGGSGLGGGPEGFGGYGGGGGVDLTQSSDSSAVGGGGPAVGGAGDGPDVGGPSVGGAGGGAPDVSGAGTGADVTGALNGDLARQLMANLGSDQFGGSIDAATGAGLGSLGFGNVTGLATQAGVIGGSLGAAVSPAGGGATPGAPIAPSDAAATGATGALDVLGGDILEQQAPSPSRGPADTWAGAGQGAPPPDLGAGPGSADWANMLYGGDPNAPPEGSGLADQATGEFLRGQASDELYSYTHDLQQMADAALAREPIQLSSVPEGANLPLGEIDQGIINPRGLPESNDPIETGINDPETFTNIAFTPAPLRTGRVDTSGMESFADPNLVDPVTGASNLDRPGAPVSAEPTLERPSGDTLTPIDRTITSPDFQPYMPADFPARFQPSVDQPLDQPYTLPFDYRYNAPTSPGGSFATDFPQLMQPSPQPTPAEQVASRFGDWPNLGPTAVTPQTVTGRGPQFGTMGPADFPTEPVFTPEVPKVAGPGPGPAPESGPPPGWPPDALLPGAVPSGPASAPAAVAGNINEVPPRGGFEGGPPPPRGQQLDLSGATSAAALGTAAPLTLSSSQQQQVQQVQALQQSLTNQFYQQLLNQGINVNDPTIQAQVQAQVLAQMQQQGINVSLYQQWLGQAPMAA